MGGKIHKLVKSGRKCHQTKLLGGPNITIGATSFLSGGAKIRRGTSGRGLGGEKRAEAGRAEAAGDRVPG